MQTLFFSMLKFSRVMTQELGVRTLQQQQITVILYKVSIVCRKQTSQCFVNTLLKMYNCNQIK